MILFANLAALREICLYLSGSGHEACFLGRSDQTKFQKINHKSKILAWSDLNALAIHHNSFDETLMKI
jgi:hypothetical protein